MLNTTMEPRLLRFLDLAVAVLFSLSLRAVGSLPATDEIASSAVEMNKNGIIRSPNFPGCCWPMTHLIEYEGQPGTGFIRIIFDDLDLPPKSVLQIHDGANETARPFPDQPTYVSSIGNSGTWIRPVIASTGGQVFLKFSPGVITSKEYVGFKATYWTVKTPGPETWKIDQPFTDCPQIGDPMDGGEVKLSTIRFPWQHIQYRYDCVWQLKPPKLKSDKLFIYFRITTMDLENGRAELHSDTSSDGPRVVHFKNLQADTHTQLKNAGQPPEGYSSRTGFYVRVRKPTEEGHFNFVYGVYTRVSKNTNACVISYEGKTLNGFVCRTEYSGKKWCIPREHICNNLPNCPDGSDEDYALCKTTTSSPTQTPHKSTCFLKECSDSSCVQLTEGCPGECGMFEKSCPNGACVSILERDCPVGLPEQRCAVTERLCKNGKCVHFLEQCPNECGTTEKRCNDGTCVSRYYGTCPGECPYTQKRCKNSQCVFKYERCPEDPCPSYKPFRCDALCVCLYTQDVCDGTYDCVDQSDETHCADTNSRNLMPLLALVVLPFFVVAIVCRICCHNPPNNPPNAAVTNGNNPVVIFPPVILAILSFSVIIAGCYYGRKRKSRGQHLSTAGATQNGSAYTGTRMQPVPAASAGISPGNGRSAVTYQPHYGTSGTRSPRDTSNHMPPPSTPAGNGPDNLLNNYSTYMSDPPSYTSNPPSLRRSNERLIPPHADERTHLDPSPQPTPGGLAPPGANTGGLTPTAPPPSYDEAMQAAVPTAPPAPSPQATPNLGLQANSGGHHSMMMNHQSLPNFSLAVQPSKTGFGSFRSYRELPTYENVMTGNGAQRKSPQNHTAPPRPPDPDSDTGEPEPEIITTTRRTKPRKRMTGLHGWGGGIFDTSSSDRDSTSSDD